MTDSQPLVSVIITTYKRANMLSKAIYSVLNQTYKNIEIIVVDDNNEDSEYRKQTENIMNNFKNIKNIKYYKHESNQNGATARNTGTKHAKGFYITYLDDDDTYRPQKILKQVNYLVNNTQFDATYCGWNKDNKRETPEYEGDLSFEILSGELVIRTNTIMMKREISLAIGGWDVRYTRNQEAVYLLRYFNNGRKIGTVQEVLVDYDSSDRSNASSSRKNEEDFMFFLEDNKQAIEKAAEYAQKNKKIIYSYRLRNIFLTYLKDRDFKLAIRIYLQAAQKYPIYFNIAVLKYLIQKITL